MIICITGLPAAGKSETAELMRKTGFRVYGIGTLIREKMTEEGIPITPETDRTFPVNLRKRYGKTAAAKILFQKLHTAKHGNLVIEGIRSRAEIAYIRRRMGNVVVIAVVAPLKTRFGRSKKRRRADAPRTLQDFVRDKDRKEGRWGMLGAIKAADYVIANTGTKADLRRSVERIVQSL